MFGRCIGINYANWLADDGFQFLLGAEEMGNKWFTQKKFEYSNY